MASGYGIGGGESTSMFALKDIGRIACDSPHIALGLTSAFRREQMLSFLAGVSSMLRYQQGRS